MNDEPVPQPNEDPALHGNPASDAPVADKEPLPMSWPRRLTLKLFALTIAALLFSSLSQRYLGHVLAGPNIDFRDYYVAAQVVRADPKAHLYDGATEGNPQLRSAPADSEMAQRARMDGFDDIEMYLYPPLFADLLTPLTHLPLATGAQAWRLLNLAIVFGSVFLLARMIHIRFLSAEFVLLLAAAYAFWPVHEAVSLGQITIVLLGLWAVGVVAYAEGFSMLSAIALALATAFKVTPVLLLPALLIWRDRRWLLSYAAAVLVCIGIMAAWNGPDTVRDYVHVVAGMGGTLPAIGNKCIASCTAWLYYHRTFDLQSVHTVLGTTPSKLNLISKLLSLLFYVVCVVRVWQGRYRITRYNRAVVLAVFALVSALLAPVSWRHGYTIALLPLVLLWERRLRDTWLGWPLWTLTVTSVAIGSLAFDLAAQGPVSQSTRTLLASIWPLSALLLCLWALRSIRADTARNAMTPEEYRAQVFGAAQEQ